MSVLNFFSYKAFNFTCYVVQLEIEKCGQSEANFPDLEMKLSHIAIVGVFECFRIWCWLLI